VGGVPVCDRAEAGAYQNQNTPTADTLLHPPAAVALCACPSIASRRILYRIKPAAIMAPVEGAAAARNNIFAYAPIGGHIALVVGLTAHVLLVARRAAKSLSPATSTRSQQPLRRRYAVLFSTLAALSLASVTAFAVTWRAESYDRWLKETATSSSPNAVYLGKYGTSADDRWYFGDWMLDIDLQKEWDAVAVSTPEGFIYTTQYFVGLMASSIFFGVEGEILPMFTSCSSLLTLRP
jgi:hypothetical protein